MNTRKIMNTLINFTRTGLPMLWKLTVPMNRAIVHNAACSVGTTLVCIVSGVIFLILTVVNAKIRKFPVKSNFFKICSNYRV